MVSRKHTHIKHYSFTPDMSSLCFSTEDIPTGLDRTLRTVGPAGTVPASSTGKWTDVCVNFCIFIACFTCEQWEHSPCLGAQLCASRCHFESNQFWEFSFMAW